MSKCHVCLESYDTLSGNVCPQCIAIIQRDGPTIGEFIELLKDYSPNQKFVFSHSKYGDFDFIGPTGASLSPDNFEKDIRPIFRLEKRS